MTVIRKNDVIIGYKGKEVSDSSELCNAVAGTHIGEESNLTVLS